MYSNIDNLVTITANEDQQNTINVVPNFLFINKPVVKINGSKTTSTKRLVIWFDVRGNQMPLDVWSLPPKIVLDDFDWQLIAVNEKGAVKQLKPVNDKEASKNKLTITRDTDGLDINPTNTITYELDEKDFDNDIRLKYNLKYKNNQRIGLNNMASHGSNGGYITIKQQTNPLITNNVFSYSESSKEHVTILNREEVIIKKRHLNLVDDLKTPILEVSNKYETIIDPQISKSAQLRAELARLSNDGISYLKTSEKGFKTTQNGDSFEIYKTGGNHYSFQTNKWVEDEMDSTYSFNESELHVNFEFNNRKLDIKVPIDPLKIRIKTTNKSNKELSKYASYKNIKPNTKFDTFIKARELKIWK